MWRGELRFRDRGEDFVLADAWRGPSGFASDVAVAEGVEVLEAQDALWRLRGALHRQPWVAPELRALIAELEGAGTWAPLREHELLDAVSRELSGVCARLRVWRLPPVPFTVPTPPQLPREDYSTVDDGLTFIEFELKNQDGEPIPFLSYELEYPEPELVRRGRLDKHGYLHVGDIPHGSYTLRFPAIGYVVPVDANRAYLDIELNDARGNGVPGEAYLVTLPDGEVRSGVLDGSGRAHLNGLPEGSCKVTFPNLDGDAWSLSESASSVEQPAEEAEEELVNAAHLVRMTGMYFDTNKCFLLPSAIDGIAKLVSLQADNAQSQVLVVGHTDTSGEPSVNDPLSLERARRVIEYLTDNVDAWLAWYGDSKPQKQRWGTAEDTHMLQRVTGQTSITKQAIKDYQKSKGLTDDGILGPKSRKQLISDYMAADGTSLPSGTTVIAHGCGESFPVVQSGDGKNEQQNRRVELFVFEKEIDPAPSGEISKPGSGDYAAWNARVVETIEIGLDGVVRGTAVIRFDDPHALDSLTGEFELVGDGGFQCTVRSSELREYDGHPRCLVFEQVPQGQAFSLRQRVGKDMLGHMFEGLAFDKVVARAARSLIARDDNDDDVQAPADADFDDAWRKADV